VLAVPWKAEAMFRDAVERGRQWIRQPAHELKGAQWSVRYAIDLVGHCARELARDRAEEMAAALTYRTIFALVPLFVLALVMFRVVGGFDELQETLQSHLYEFFGVPQVPAAYADLDPVPGERVPVEVADPEELIERERVRQQTGGAVEDPHERAEEERQVRVSLQRALSELTAKVANLNFASIGVVGVLLLIYAAMALAFSVEYDFNIIFQSPKGRPWHLRIAIYWSMITLGSGLLALSLYLSGQFVLWIGELGAYAPLLWFLSRLLAFLASWVLLFLLYSLMPNTSVHLRPAMIGSFVAALFWETGKVGFQTYVSQALPYAALYGVLGLIPLFLFWIYISWLLVLFGLELTYTLQVMHGRAPSKEQEEQIPRLPGDPDWLIPMLVEIGHAFREGQVVERQELAERLGLPARVIDEFSVELEKAGLVRCIGANGVADAQYVLARPPERIPMDEVLELGRQLSASLRRREGDADWSCVEKLFEAKRQAVREVTLAQLLEELVRQPVGRSCRD
jgi:membrane protein